MSAAGDHLPSHAAAHCDALEVCDDKIKWRCALAPVHEILRLSRSLPIPQQLKRSRAELTHPSKQPMRRTWGPESMHHENIFERAAHYLYHDQLTAFNNFVEAHPDLITAQSKVCLIFTSVKYVINHKNSLSRKQYVVWRNSAEYCM